MKRLSLLMGALIAASSAGCNVAQIGGGECDTCKAATQHVAQCLGMNEEDIAVEGEITCDEATANETLTKECEEIVVRSPSWNAYNTVNCVMAMATGNPILIALYCAKGPSTKANWSFCLTDGECQSKICGCNGGPEKRCLPNASYPKQCGGPNPPQPPPPGQKPPIGGYGKLNWWPCEFDWQCHSKVCGCNGGAVKMCLPSPSYPKSCGAPPPPPTNASCHAGLGSWGFCTPGCRCGYGQGDCDNDMDCAPGLRCKSNYGPFYGKPLGMDVCLP